PETAEQTWVLVRAAVLCRARVGCTLPARWQRSLRDADEAVDLGLRVRIVKGQWTDRGAGTNLSDSGVRDRFLAVVRRLAGRAGRPACGTPGLRPGASSPPTPRAHAASRPFAG